MLMSLGADLKYALDPVAFASELLGMELDPWQADVLAGEGRRDLLCCSRQSGKSTTAAILGLHQALYRPNSLCLLVSPSLRQSSELFRAVMTLRERLPNAPELTEDNRLSMAVRGGGRVVSLPSSESTIRGYSGATLLVIDEAARVPDPLYHAVTPMLATTAGRLIGMSTPFGRRGWYAEAWHDQPDWQKTRITVYDVPRITREWIQEQRRIMPAWWFEQEFECQFKESEDAVFRHEHVMAALDPDVRPLFAETEARPAEPVEPLPL